MTNFKSTSRIRNTMPNNVFRGEREPVISHANANKAPGKLWITTALTGALLLIVGLVLASSAGPSLVALILIPTGVACFLVAAIVKPLEMIHAELKALNAKS